VADMSRPAITARLRQMADAQRSRGFVDKGVDMSKQAVTRRLQALCSLSDLCLRLSKARLRSNT